MKYFIDTEFIEGFHKPLFGKRRHFIDLISIGIVCEDGRTYQAISREYDYKKASDWVKENVIAKLYAQTVSPGAKYEMGLETGCGLTPSDFHKSYGKSNSQISLEIIQFVNPHRASPQNFGGRLSDLADSGYMQRHNINQWFNAAPEFYGYYSDYDWVLFCSLFGTMMSLPDGFPMYCIDLKQMLDEKANSLMNAPQHTSHGLPLTLSEKLKIIKGTSGYPQEDNEHSAFDDAKWNKKLYDYILSI